jgi:hypothetical protein
MAVAGFNGVVRASSDNFVASDVVVGCVVDANFDQIMAELDVTCFGNTNVRRIYGLGDVSASLTVVWEAADAGQTLFRTQQQGRLPIDLRYLPNGTNGFQGRFIITSISTSQAVDGRVEATFTLTGDGTSITYI